jgi:hypothetical protein
MFGAAFRKVISFIYKGSDVLYMKNTRRLKGGVTAACPVLEGLACNIYHTC